MANSVCLSWCMATLTTCHRVSGWINWFHIYVFSLYSFSWQHNIVYNSISLHMSKSSFSSRDFKRRNFPLRSPVHLLTQLRDDERRALYFFSSHQLRPRLALFAFVTRSKYSWTFHQHRQGPVAFYTRPLSMVLLLNANASRPAL